MMDGTNSAKRQHVILCADDYAISPAVSRGILKLAEEHRLSAASVMTTLPQWPHEAQALAEFRDRMSIGLHLNLTHGSPDMPMPRLAPRNIYPVIGMLALLAHGGWLLEDELDGAIESQLDAFESHFGFPPDHIDGHQHAHALPQVRDRLLKVLKRRYATRPPFVRDPEDSMAHIAKRFRGASKAAAIAWLTSGFDKMLRREGFVTNDTFAGISSFSPAIAAVRADFESAFKAQGPVHLIMCHPGTAPNNAEEADRIARRRQAELEYLLNDETLPSRIWRPSREKNDPSIDWYAVTARTT